MTLKSQDRIWLEKLRATPAVYVYRDAKCAKLIESSTSLANVKHWHRFCIDGLAFRRDKETDGLHVVSYGITALGKAALGLLPAPRPVVHRAPATNKRRAR